MCVWIIGVEGQGGHGGKTGSLVRSLVNLATGIKAQIVFY